MLICKYCNDEIEDKKRDSRKADGLRYHIKCLRIFRKKIDKQKQLGKISPGKENEVNVNDVK